MPVKTHVKPSQHVKSTSLTGRILNQSFHIRAPPSFPMFLSSHVISTNNVPQKTILVPHIPLSVILNQQFCALSPRTFHSSSSLDLGKEESKVEKTAKAIKDNAKEEPEPTLPTAAKKTLTRRFVGVCKHYYHGFRLLAIDVRICSKLIWQLMNVKSLTRREYNQVRF